MRLVARRVQFSLRDTSFIQARLRNLTYSSPLYVDVKKTTVRPGEEPEVMVYQKLYIGKVPIMLRCVQVGDCSCIPPPYPL